MKLRGWPNRLGWDLGDTEIWIASSHGTGFAGYRVFGPHRNMFVPKELAADPIEASRICKEFGVLHSELENSEHHVAQWRFWNRWESVADKIMSRKLGVKLVLQEARP